MHHSLSPAVLTVVQGAEAPYDANQAWSAAQPTAGRACLRKPAWRDRCDTFVSC